MIFLLVFLILFVEHTIANLTPTPTVENDYTINLLKRVAQAPQPSCTWEGHCLGDNCHSNDDCDFEWVCTGGKCSVDGSTSMSTSVKVPVTSTGTSPIPSLPQSIPFHTSDPVSLVTTTAVSFITSVLTAAHIVTLSASDATSSRSLGGLYESTTSTFVSAASSCMPH